MKKKTIQDLSVSPFIRKLSAKSKVRLKGGGSGIIVEEDIFS